MAPACVGKEGHISGGVFDHSTHEEDPQHLPEQRSPAAVPEGKLTAPDHRYSETLRLPLARLGVVRFSLSFPDTLWGSSGFVSRVLAPTARLRGASRLCAPGVFPHTGGTPTPDVP